jgi:hypothetical protein
VPVAVAVQDDRLTGPAVPADQIPGRLDLVRATGARVTRVDVLWSDVAPTRPADEADPADPAYRWERADAILRGYAERGIAAIVSSYSTPAWAADGPEVPPLGPISPRLPDAAAYGRFAGALARRYSGSTRDAQGRVLPRVRHFEIWNEPNIGVFLSPQSDPSGARPARDRYVEVVGQAGPQIRAANPGAVIIAGVAGPRGRTGEDGTGTLDWIDAVAGAQVGFDAWSQHIYPAAAPDEPTEAVPAWATIPRILDALDRHRPGIPMYITEAGYTTAETPFRKVSVTEEEQAANLRAMYRLPLDPARIPVIVWFNLQDNPAWPSGLLREDGGEKPSMAAFREAVAASGGRGIPARGP